MYSTGCFSLSSQPCEHQWLKRRELLAVSSRASSFLLVLSTNPLKSLTIIDREALCGNAKKKEENPSLSLIGSWQ